MRTFLSVAVLGLAISSAFAANLKQSIDFKLCPEAKVQNMGFTEVDITPFPLKKGVKADFELIGTPTVAINQKYIQIVVYQKGQNIYTTHIGGPNTTPAGGNYDYALSYGLPSIVPAGTYELHMSVISNTGDSYGCFMFDVTF